MLFVPDFVHIRLTSQDLSHKITYSVPTETFCCRSEGNSKEMANHFSALKRSRQTQKRTATNRANTSRLRTALREIREIIARGDKASAQTTYRETVSALDKAIQKGVIHKNTAARYKSRLAARVRALGAK